MDILVNICILFIIIVLFMFILYSRNPIIFAVLIVISLTGMVISFNDTLYLTTGWNTSLSFDDSGQVIGATTEPIKDDYNNYNYIFRISYLMSMIVSVIYWSMGDQMKKEEDDD